MGTSTPTACRPPARHLLGGLLAIAAGTACSQPQGPPNILLISIDTLRADHLPMYGYERDTAPRLARLAEEGVLFERATASSSWTLPSHLTMLTGLSVSAHGVCDDRLWTRKDSAGQPIPAPLRGTFVSERLKAEGYRCAGFYSWKYLDSQFGFGPGFEAWERLGHTFYSHPVVGPEFERLRGAGDEDGMRALAAAHPALFDDTTPSSPEVVDRALGWLGQLEEQQEDAPYFLFVHLFDVHDPYVPPAPFRDRFDPDYAGPIDGRRITAPDSPVRGDMDPRDLEHLIALYDGEIAWVDSEIARLLDGIAKHPSQHTTLTIVTSDHGEEFFEHGHKTHRRQLHRESVHVPLLLSWPGVLPGGKRVSNPVGLIDLAPTLCAAAGLAPPDSVEGIDLLPLARDGKASAPDDARLLSSELFVFDSGSGPSPERHLGLAFDQHYALGTTPAGQATRWRLFDLNDDPYGRGPGHAVAAGSPIAADLEQHLERLKLQVRALRANLPGRAESLRALDEEDLRQLAAMGYGGQEEASDGEGSGLCLEGCVWR